MHKYFIDGENLKTLKVTLINVLDISEEEMYKRINKIPDDVLKTLIDEYIYELFSDKIKSAKLEYIYAFHMTVGTNEIIKSIKKNNLVNRDESILIILKDLYKNIKPNISEKNLLNGANKNLIQKLHHILMIIMIIMFVVLY